MRYRTLVSAAAVLMLLAVSVMIFDSPEGAPTRANAPALTSASVSPTTGYNTTLFNFTVWYADFDNDVPNYVAVFIDNVQYNMTCSVGGPLNVTRGVMYFYNTYLTTGNHTYFFFANNTANETVRSPATGSNTLVVGGAPPPGPSLSGGTHTPARPTAGTPANFTVTYKDTNGNFPSKVTVDYIYTDNSMKTYYDNVTMNISGTNYKTGVLCFAWIAFGYGTISYRFSAINSQSEKATYPSSGYLTFNITQNSPSDSKPILSDVTISPNPPMENENFTISAVYSDKDNDMPSYLILNLYNDRYGAIWHWNMTVTGSDYVSGVSCSYMLNLDDGTYYFSIDAGNRNASVTYPSPGGKQILNVSRNNTNPTNPLSSGGHSPSSPMHNQTVNFTVTYTDAGNLAPSTVKLAIGLTGANTSYSYYNMSVGSGTNYTRGVVFFKTLDLPTGNYSYYFSAIPGNMLTIIFFYPAYANPLSLYVRPNGTMKDNPPQLYTSSYSPQNPTSAQTINFTIYYKDIDGGAPTYVRLVFKNGNSLVNHTMTGAGTSFSRGVVYYKSLKLNSGNHTYYFATSSGIYSARFPSSGNLIIYVSTPSSDQSPTLYTPGVSPARPNSSTPVNFTIYYKDADNDAPSSMVLYLSGGSRNYTAYNMVKTGTGYTIGVQLYRVLTLSAGNYTYYFQVKSTNFTVTNPSSSVSTLYVAPVSGGGGDGGDDVTPPDDDTPPDDEDDDTEPGIDGRAEITSDDEGGADMDLVEIEEGLTISLVEFSDGKMEVEVTSDTPVGRIVILGMEDDLFGDVSMEDLLILLDGEEIALSDLQDLLDGDGTEPAYYIVYEDGSYDLYVYIPETTTHSLIAQVREEDHSRPDDYSWVFLLLGILAVIVIVILIAISFLTAAQRKKKTEAYFEDFEIGMKEDDRVTKGDLEDKEWDDLVE